ncbi:MAG: hypothetical protein AAFW60_00515 [Pseudomonadota bacterium]
MTTPAPIMRVRARRDVLLALRLASSSMTISKMVALTSTSHRQLHVCLNEAQQWGYVEHDGKPKRTYWITAKGEEFQREAKAYLFGETL